MMYSTIPDTSDDKRRGELLHNGKYFKDGLRTTHDRRTSLYTLGLHSLSPPYRPHYVCFAFSPSTPDSGPRERRSHENATNDERPMLLYYTNNTAMAVCHLLSMVLMLGSSKDNADAHLLAHLPPKVRRGVARRRREVSRVDW